jgi:multidrug efflux pump subunit AcrA (membrane-fusion protein)
VRHFKTVLVLLALCPFVLAQGMPPQGVILGAVTSEKVHSTITGVATVKPWLRTVLSAEIAGLVESYPLREGDQVVAGETVVCELKRTSLLIDLSEAEALLARAEAEAETAVRNFLATMEEERAQMQRAERELERSVELYEKQVINKAEYDRAEADSIAARYRFERAEQDFELAKQGNDPTAKALKAEVRRAKARLDRVKDEIKKTKIVSPADGRVARRMTEVGSWVTTGGPVIEILTLDPVLIRMGVNEKYIAGLAVGDAVDVRVDAHPGRLFNGKIRHLVPEADPRSRSFPVLVEVANADGALLAGMFARVEIRSGEGAEALTVPKDAIVLGPMGAMVFTIKAPEGEGLPTAVAIPVVTGGTTQDRVAVTGPGLAVGVPIVTTGNEKLMPGMSVIPQGGAEKPGGGR